MDFSKYTLVSFGDSFTFGDGTVDRNIYGKDKKIYRKECNKYSYTQVLKDKFNFKDSINFGIQSGSNDSTIMAVQKFLKNNTDKVFVTVNLTEDSRIIYTGDPIPRNKNMVEKTRLYTGSVWKFENSNLNRDVIKYAPKMFLYHYTKEFNLIRHFRNLETLDLLFKTYNVPNIVFDILCQVDKLMYNQTINTDEIYKRDLDVYSYCVDDSYNYDFNYLNTKWFVDNGYGAVNMKEYVSSFNNDNFASPYETDLKIKFRHWSKLGHLKASEILSDYIKSKY